MVDLGSANGTYVNGQIVDQVLLRSGDQVRLGRHGAAVTTSSPSEAERPDGAGGLAEPRESRSDRSAILRSIPVGEGSRVLEAPATGRGMAQGPAGQSVGDVPGHPGDQPYSATLMSCCRGSCNWSSSRSARIARPS